MKTFISILLFSLPFYAAQSSTPVKHKVMGSFDGVVWGFDFLSPSEVLVTLRDGDGFYYNLKTRKKRALVVPKTEEYGQGGLLDVKVHKITGQTWVYFTFTDKIGDMRTTSLARGKWSEAGLTELKTIFSAKIKGDTSRHFGSRIAFDGQFVFMTIGDRGARQYAQDLSFHNGKILRLNLDGTAAKGNPFIGKAGALPEIWSWGHRNPQGIDFIPGTNELYSCEFGPRGGDELNFIRPGVNYGWPKITFGREYHGPKIGPTHMQGLEQPVIHWTPSISPSGMAFYDGDKRKDWKGNLFLANLSSTHLRRVVLKNGKVVAQEALLEKLAERLRHVETSPDGYLYVSTDSGMLLRLE